MKNQRPRNLVIREIKKVGIGGILKRKYLVQLALNAGINEANINNAIYKLIEEEVIVIASAGMYAVRVVDKEVIPAIRMKLTTESALSIQVGGTHYSSMKIQPVVFITRAQLTFIQGNIVKYVCRAYNKNGIQDIEKCIHYAQLAIELRHFPKMKATWNKYMNKFIDDNELNESQTAVVCSSCKGEWTDVIEWSGRLIKDLVGNNGSVSENKTKETVI